MQGPLGWREKEGKAGGEGSGLWDLCPWGLRTGSGRWQCSGEGEEGLALDMPVQGGREARSRGEEGDCGSRREEAGWMRWSQTRCFSTGGCYSSCLCLAQSVSRTRPTPASGPQFPQVYVGWKIPKGASRFGDSLSLIQVDGSTDLSLLLGSEPAMVAGPS